MPLTCIVVEVNGPLRQCVGSSMRAFFQASPKAGPRPSGERRCFSVSRVMLELAGRLAKEI
jgi:hypothetical protein